MDPAIAIRPATAGDDVAGWIRRSWAGTTMAVHGQLYDVTTLPAIVAVEGEQLVGVLTYTVTGQALEIVSCDADPPGRGTGRALVEEATTLARRQGVRRVWCTTTNDNLRALGFWQALGFRLVALRPDAVAGARVLKPSIPDRGHRELPIRDELDLEARVVDLEPRPAQVWPEPDDAGASRQPAGWEGRDE